VLAPLSADVQAELGVDHDLLVSTVGSHDTASAVVGVPAATPNFGYISCGTWGLVGVELGTPVLTEASRRANFTNERGVDRTIRYLRNVMALWLLSESLRAWSLRGLDLHLTDLLVAAAALPPGGPRIDPDDPAFLPPGDMPARIVHASRDTDQPIPEPAEPAVVVRCILDSLAAAFAATVLEAEHLSGHPVDVVHIVGGGSQNALLCQLTADAAEGRSSPGRSRRPRSATSSCRPARTAPCTGTSRRCAAAYVPPPGSTAMSQASCEGSRSSLIVGRLGKTVIALTSRLVACRGRAPLRPELYDSYVQVRNRDEFHGEPSFGRTTSSPIAWSSLCAMPRRTTNPQLGRSDHHVRDQKSLIWTPLDSAPVGRAFGTRFSHAATPATRFATARSTT
jgi:hypothetical protein